MDILFLGDEPTAPRFGSDTRDNSDITIEMPHFGVSPGPSPVSTPPSSPTSLTPDIKTDVRSNATDVYYAKDN